MQQLSNQKPTADVLSCLLIPVQGGRLLLPNVTVAELIPYQMPQYKEGLPGWVLGILDWRGTLVPVVSYEQFIGQKTGAHSQDVRIAVLNTPGEQEKMRFFGLVVQGIPSLVKLEDSTVKENAQANLLRGQLMAVTHESGTAIIPDLDAIEKELLKISVL
jgi:chemosensory pili system protein ChpC